MAAAPLHDPLDHPPRMLAFWREFCAADGTASDTPFQHWYFGDSAALAHELVELVIHGPKRGTAGLHEFIQLEPAFAPVQGGFSVVTEFDGTPRCVIRTTSVDTRRFIDVDAAFAWDEGEGDRTLQSWRDGHRRYFGREAPARGLTFADDSLVVLERFELLWPRAAADPLGGTARSARGSR